MKNHWCESCESVVRIVDAIPVSMSYGEYIKVKFRCEYDDVDYDTGDPYLGLMNYDQTYPKESIEDWKIGDFFCGLLMITNLYPVKCCDLDPVSFLLNVHVDWSSLCYESLVRHL